MKKIAILSDTHGLLRPEVKTILQECDVILHAGDIDSPALLAELESIAVVYAVRGNADKEWAEGLPKTRLETIAGKKFYLVHNKKDIAEDAVQADVIVYGHSHRYDEHSDGAQIWLNPGSCGKRRFGQPITMTVLEIEEDGSMRFLRRELSGERAAGKAAGDVDWAQLVRNVMEEIDMGMPVERIAEKNRITPELAEQICRMYTTHPGIDVDGIINRILDR